MRSTTLLVALAIVTALGGCASQDASVSGGYVEIAPGHCTLDGTGAIGTETVGGSVSDTSGSVVGSWLDTTSTGIVLDGTASSLRCRLNGSRSATVTGTATWNGAPGYYFTLTVLDNGGASPPVRTHGTPETDTLEATRTYSPSRWTDGHLAWTDGAEVVIPGELPVTVGNAGNQWTRMTFVDFHTGLPIRCNYRGGASMPNPRTPSDVAAGLTYEFAFCEVWSCPDGSDSDDDVDEHGCDRDDDECGWVESPSHVPGVSIDSASVDLHVQNGSSRYPSRHAARTTVSVGLSVTPYIAHPGTPDHYTLAVFPNLTDPAIYSVDADLTAGDLTVTIH